MLVPLIGVFNLYIIETYRYVVSCDNVNVARILYHSQFVFKYIVLLCEFVFCMFLPSNIMIVISGAFCLFR